MNDVPKDGLSILCSLLEKLLKIYYILQIDLPKVKDFYKEIGYVHNCTLRYKDYSPSDFTPIDVMFSLCKSV